MFVCIYVYADLASVTPYYRTAGSQWLTLPSAGTPISPGPVPTPSSAILPK